MNGGSGITILYFCFIIVILIAL